MTSAKARAFTSPCFSPARSSSPATRTRCRATARSRARRSSSRTRVTVQFIVHKNGGLTGPRAETPTHYIFMGIDVDHNVAVQLALQTRSISCRRERPLARRRDGVCKPGGRPQHRGVGRFHGARDGARPEALLHGRLAGVLAQAAPGAQRGAAPRPRTDTPAGKGDNQFDVPSKD